MCGCSKRFMVSRNALEALISSGPHKIAATIRNISFFISCGEIGRNFIGNISISQRPNLYLEHIFFCHIWKVWKKFARRPQCKAIAIATVLYEGHLYLCKNFNLPKKILK